MSDNYSDKDIEKLIFGRGLESSEIEPSEKFWNKAYEDIIQRENLANARRIARWRGAFFILCASILLLSFYAFYMHNEVSDIKQQLTKIESTQTTIVQQNRSRVLVNNTSITTEKTPLNSEPVSLAQEKGIQNSNKTDAITSSSKASANSAPYTENRRSGTISSGSPTILAKVQGVNLGSHKPHNQSISNSKTALVENLANSNDLVSGNTETVLATATSHQIPNNQSSVQVNSTQKSLKQDTTVSTVTSIKKNDSLTVKTCGLDSVNSIVTSKIKTPITLAGILSKISVSAFYAPCITDDFLSSKNNDPTNNVTTYKLQTQEDNDLSFATGVRLAYDISNKCNIQVGCYYSQYNYDIYPTVIHPQQQENGQFGYSIPSSSGIIYIPNSTVSAHLGDSIKASAECSRSYISIPIQVKYKFAASTKLNFYVDGGFSINISDYSTTDVHWENTALQEGDVCVNGFYGLKTVEYSFNLGIGASYLIGKGISVYSEPFVDGAFTSINKNTPVITYPYLFGLAVGISYHF